ncbi:MAG TPA: hypothetical protein VE819_02605 [Steroidobacteraceae bacterium]|nr:hypothetical protein [Steroidobacteraceae bacterium]
MIQRSVGLLAAVGVITLLVLSSTARGAAAPPFNDLPSYVKWVQKSHKAPFDRDGAAMPPGGVQELIREQAARSARALPSVSTTAHHNVKVNQDRNPWPKAEIGAAIDPVGGAWVVMSNDFRRNFDQMFFHVSTDGGVKWTDDALVGGSDPFTGFIPSTFQSDPGVSFDSSGNSYLSSITGNLIFDGTNGYLNTDTEIDVVQGFADGIYASLLPTPVDVQPCNGTFTGTFTCDMTLDKPLVTTDSNLNSPKYGTTYVYYTVFCNLPTACTDGHASIPAFSSAIVEVHSPGPNEPFSAPALVSGRLHQTQFSSMVIDAAGTPHVFFDDFTDPAAVHMWQATLHGTTWLVGAAPVVSFAFNGLSNINWTFRDAGAEAPGCGIHKFTAYCAFSANQVDKGRMESTPSVYLASVPLGGQAVTVARVNNDVILGQKHHFFAWATATPSGAVYVGWYDDRRDPFNTRVDYFVGKSTDGGKTFPVQQPVNDVSFNPCTGFPGCAFFGDYTQLVSGTDGVVRAAWSDTRDAASMQIWSQVVGF